MKVFYMERKNIYKLLFLLNKEVRHYWWVKTVCTTHKFTINCKALFAHEDLQVPKPMETWSTDDKMQWYKIQIHLISQTDLSEPVCDLN